MLMFTYPPKKSVGIAVILSAFILGYGLSTLLHPQATSPVKVLRENSDEYKYINPLLLVDNSTSSPAAAYNQLKSNVSTYISKAQSTHKADRVAFYFRELNSGRWTGVNEDQTFDPGSLGKVSVLMAYLRAAEEKPTLLSEKIAVSKSTYIDDKDQYYKPAAPVLPGRSYTTQELIEKMIIDSDNNALFLLGNAMGANTIRQQYKEMLLPVDQTGNIVALSPFEYSKFFRLLFNATYISRELSEKTLALLSSTKFTQGLVSGAPQSTIIAHKFGEKNIFDPSTNKLTHELHDCGIVYYPEHPYFVCIMTSGAQFPDLERVIKDISGITWNAVDAYARK